MAERPFNGVLLACNTAVPGYDNADLSCKITACLLLVLPVILTRLEWQNSAV